MESPVGSQTPPALTALEVGSGHLLAWDQGWTHMHLRWMGHGPLGGSCGKVESSSVATGWHGWTMSRGPGGKRAPERETKKKMEKRKGKKKEKEKQKKRK